MDRIHEVQGMVMKTEYKIKVTITTDELVELIRSKRGFSDDSIIEVVVEDSSDVTEVAGRWYFRDGWFYVSESWKHDVCPTTHSIDTRIEVLLSNGYVQTGRISDWVGAVWNQTEPTRIVKFQII